MPSIQPLCDANQLDSLYPAIMPETWPLDPDCTFLNHGSFGACPQSILQYQHQLQTELEANPLRFLLDREPDLTDRARQVIADLINAPAKDVVFVRNATAGVNAVLRSLHFAPGDQIVITNHSYNACSNIAQFVAERAHAELVVAQIPFPIHSPDQAMDAVMACVTPRTKLVMIDHITSPTALILPVKSIITQLNQLGIDSLIDGAHAPGMIELDMQDLNPTYYTGNCHKWLCAPKTAALLYIQPDKQPGIEPEIISHGRNDWGAGPGSFQRRFCWQGTEDPTARICIPKAIQFLRNLMPGGLSQLMKRNQKMAIDMRQLICSALNIHPPCPDEMLGSMATIPLGQGYQEWETSPPAKQQQQFMHHLQRELKIELPHLPFGDPCIFHTRISCQAYNHGSQYLKLIEAFQSFKQ